jgi:hypothetical protein
MVALDLDVVEGVRREDRDVVLVGQSPAGGHFEVVKHKVVIGQILAETLDRPRLAVVFRRADSMDDRHLGVPHAGDEPGVFPVYLPDRPAQVISPEDAAASENPGRDSAKRAPFYS